MEIKQDYTLLFNTITDVIQKLEESLKEAGDCIQMMKEAQKTAEEIYMQETEAGSEPLTNEP